MQPFHERFDPCSMFIIAVVGYIAARKLADVVPDFARSMCFIGGMAFLGTVGWAYTLANPAKPFELLDVVLVGVVGAVGTAVAAAITLPPTAAVWRCVRKWQADSEKRQREEEEFDQQEQDREARAEAWERERPDRERRERDKELQRRAEADANQRSDEVRARCETEYDRHSLEIAVRFPRAAFDEFVSRHMGSDRPPDVVEKRGEMLLGLIRDHVHAVETVQSTKRIDGIIAKFEGQKMKVASAGLDPNDAEQLLMDMDTQRADAIRRALLEDLS